jgi:hypothetical protein
MDGKLHDLKNEFWCSIDTLWSLLRVYDYHWKIMSYNVVKKKNDIISPDFNVCNLGYIFFRGIRSVLQHFVNLIYCRWSEKQDKRARNKFMCTQNYTQKMKCPFCGWFGDNLIIIGDLTIKSIFFLINFVLRGKNICSVMFSISLFLGASLEMMVC